MPTARELLEQADALMRRNRGGDIPLLTDSVTEALSEAAPRDPSPREPGGSPPHAPSPDDSGRPSSESAASAAEASDVEVEVEPPVLTDVVEEEAVDLLPLPAGRSGEDPAPWLGPDTVDPALHSITGASPDTVDVVPPMTLRSVPAAPPSVAALETELEASSATPTLRAAGSAPTPPPAGSVPPERASAPEAGDDERWRALAEQISMQVLQRLDLFVDAGLKAQLAAHLQPIVARAGNELVEAINDHVGQLVRSYVAEAIEREITQWRQGQP